MAEQRDKLTATVDQLQAEVNSLTQQVALLAVSIFCLLALAFMFSRQLKSA